VIKIGEMRMRRVMAKSVVCKKFVIRTGGADHAEQGSRNAAAIH